MDNSLILFISIQMLNVIISTFKSVITVNGSPFTAAAINSISYTFAACVTKMLTVQPFEIVITVTLITNMTGVYIAKILLDKTKAERLQTISATLRTDNKDVIEEQLRKRSVQYTLIPAFNDRFLINIYSYSRGESSIVKEILGNTNIKFTITENRKAL